MPQNCVDDIQEKPATVSENCADDIQSNTEPENCADDMQLEPATVSEACADDMHPATVSESINYVTIITESGEEFHAPVDEYSLSSIGASDLYATDQTRHFMANVDEPTTEQKDQGYVTIVTEDGVEFHIPVEKQNDCSTDLGGTNESAIKRTRKRFARPQCWQRNVEKSKHYQGKSYKTYRGSNSSSVVPAKFPQQCDCQKCRYHCSDNFPHEIRKRLCEEFYNLGSYSRQKDFVVSHVMEIPTRSRIVSADRHRQVSRAFYLTNEGIRKRVCGNFFCKTLDLKIRSVQKYFEVHRGSLSIGSLTDQRGKHAPRNKTVDWKLNLLKSI